MACRFDHALLPLNEAAQLLPGSVSAGRLYRWSRRGVRRIYLETTRRGHMLFTSRRAIEQFLDQLEKRASDPGDGEALLKEAGL